eukprot:PhF_6_TR3410/c0_g1_i3/m.4925
MSMSISSLVLVFLIVSICHAQIPTSGVTTFSHALKNFPLPPNRETDIYATRCQGTLCAVTLIHIPSIYPGSGCPWDWENGRFRLYIDNETKPSIDVSVLDLAHVGARAAVGNNAPTDGSPFGHTLFGKTAKSGAVYSTIRIPFGSAIRATIQAPSTCNTTQTFWFIIRGVMNIPGIVFGDFILPPTARVRILENVTLGLKPLDYITLSPGASAGTLILSSQEVQSTDLNYLEGCVRVFIDGSNTPQFLSSGTEDYYLSASYFDEGRFTTPLSGLTYLNGAATAMYKTHERDPVMWTKYFQIAFRNMEDASCPTKWPST